MRAANAERQSSDESSSAKVGVVVRTKDRPTMLRRALADIAAQSYQNWEIVVVNDGGDAEAVEMALRSLQSGSRGRVTVVHHERAHGRSAAANVGITALHTEYVVLHDDDDRWHPDFLQATVGWLDQHPDTIGVVARTEIVYEAENDGVFEETGRAPFWADMTGITYAELLQINRFVPIAYLYRRAVHDEVGLYREDVHAAEDWEFNLRVACRHRIGYLGDRTLAYWMQRPRARGEMGNSMFTLAGEHEYYDRLIRDDALRAYVAKHGDGLPLFLARLVKDEVALQLDERQTLGQRLFGVLRRWRRDRMTR